jgi:hypothetical protein
MRNWWTGAAALALAACSGGNPQGEDDLAALDRELAANTSAPARDPVLTASLRDQIMVDPALAQSSNANAVRPPSRPDTGAVPPADIARLPDTTPTAAAPAPSGDCPQCRARGAALTLDALAGAQPDPRLAGCAGRVRYSFDWANRLPAAVPLYPDARVTEAAGTDAGCSLRVVSFRSGASVEKLAGFYWSRGRAGGYAPEHRAEGVLHVVGGARGGAAYVAYLQPRADGGTDVDLVASGG